MISFDFKANTQRHSLPTVNQGSTLKPTSATSKKVVYCCECGKKYMSFPALYVHGRIKHNHKLSSNSKMNLWTTRQTGQFIQKTFHLHTEIENLQNRPQNQNHELPDLLQNKQAQMIIQGGRGGDLLDELLAKFQLSSMISSQKKEILLDFCKYLKTKWGSNTTRDQIQLIPYQLNSFAIERLPLAINKPLWGTEWSVECDGLLEFGEWLYKYNYTKYLAVRND